MRSYRAQYGGWSNCSRYRQSGGNKEETGGGVCGIRARYSYIPFKISKEANIVLFKIQFSSISYDPMKIMARIGPNGTPLLVVRGNLRMRQCTL